MAIYEILAAVQKKLKSDKDNFNKFGGFKYRTAEGILGLVKPLLPDTVCLICTDEIKDGVFQSVAVLTDGEQSIRAVGVCPVAGFEQNTLMKGMSLPQSFGAMSSYCRKYALAGLFAISDSSLDPDALHGADEQPQAKPQAQTQSHSDKIRTAAQNRMDGLTGEKLDAEYNRILSTLANSEDKKIVSIVYSEIKGNLLSSKPIRPIEPRIFEEI